MCVLLSVVSNSLQPHGLRPTRLLYPWDSPGKNAGVGCHALLQGIFLIQGLDPGIESRSPALQADSLRFELPGRLNASIIRSIFNSPGKIIQFSSVQSLNRVRLFATP